MESIRVSNDGEKLGISVTNNDEDGCDARQEARAKVRNRISSADKASNMPIRPTDPESDFRVTGKVV